MLEDFETKKGRLSKALEDARTEFKKAEKKVTRAYNAYEKLIKEEESKTPMTIERALITYLDSGIENSAGFHFLDDIIWKGDDPLYQYGITISGYLEETNQRSLVLKSEGGSDEFLEAVSDKLMLFIPYLKPGALRKEKDFLENSIVIIIRTSNDYDNWMLCWNETDQWFLCNAKRYRHEIRKPKDNTLLGALKYIRDNLTYDGD